MARTAILMVMCAGLLAGCGTVRGWFGGSDARRAGLPFTASLGRGEDPREFSVAVSAPGVNLPQARESLRYPATTYCLQTFGASDIDWVTDPATGDWAVARSADGGLAARGRCTAL